MNNVVDLKEFKIDEQLEKLRKCKTIKEFHNTKEQTFTGMANTRGGCWKTEAEADAEEAIYKMEVTRKRLAQHELDKKITAFRRFEEKRGSSRFWKFNERRFRRWLANVDKKQRRRDGRKN